MARLRGEIKADGSTVWSIQRGGPVSAEELQEAMEAIRFLEEEHEQRQLNLVLANFKAFHAFWRSLHQESERAKQEAVNPILRLQTELATRLFNWLQSMRAFIDHTQARLSRRYGKASPQLDAFREATSHEFDQHFAYRFLWKLRNYGHIDFPALDLRIHETAPIGQPTRFSANVMLRRDVLLANYDEWGQVKNDLEAQAEEFEVIPLMVEVMDSLDRIRLVVSSAEQADLQQALAFLETIRTRLPEGAGSPTLMSSETDEAGQPLNYQMIHIPPFARPDEWDDE